MTRNLDTDPEPTMTSNKTWIARLNVLLRFAYLDPWKLTNGAWEDLLDDLFFALYNLKRDRSNPLAEFQEAATREGVGKAQRGLKEHLECQEDRHIIQLAEQELIIFNTPDKGDYRYRYRSKDFPTMVFVQLADSLFMSELTRADFLRCSLCQTWFVPKRKPRKGTPTYCSKKCANVVAARNFRANKKKSAKKKRGTKKQRK